MAIQDDYNIDYVNKCLEYTGGFTNNIPDSTYDVNELYTFIQDTFDEPAQLDDDNPMGASTPTSYQVLYPWFLDDESIKSLYGGAIDSSGWTKAASEGITALIYQSSPPIEPDSGSTDKGVSVTGGTSGATGTILWVDQTRRIIWVRNTNANQFQNNETIQDTGPTQCNVTTAVSNGFRTGESRWTNMYTIGTIVDDTDIYIIQNDSKLTSWWSDGHIDVLVKVRQEGSLIDAGDVTVYARQYGTLFDHFKSALAAGGRQPVPLAAATDLNNATGYRIITTGAFGPGGSDVFTIGEVITGGTSSAKGIVTAQVEDTSITYYLVGKDLTDFQSGEVITGEESSTTATSSGAPSNAGPATWSNVTLSFGAILRDLNNGAGDRKYSIEIDCNQRVLSEVYQRLKYLTRRGSTTALGPAGSYQQDGEQYIGNILRLNYESEVTAFTEGDLVSGEGASPPTGVIVAAHDDGSTGQLILSQVRGTFVAGTTIADESNGSASIATGGVVIVTPTKQSPFGTFAGGTFFGAPGVFVTDVASADIQAYQLTDDLGVLQLPPNEVAISVTGLNADDRAAIFRLVGAGGAIDKTTYSNTVQGRGASTIVVSEAIASDEPAGSYLRVIDKSETNEPEARLEYSSWTTSTFTLRSGDTGTTTGQAATQAERYITLIDAGAFATFPTSGLKIGDVIRNTTDDSWANVIGKIDDDTLETTKLMGPDGSDFEWQTGDGWTSNILPFDATTSDKTYVTIVDEVVDSGVGVEASNSLIYDTDIPILVRVRVKGIKPFSQYSTVTSSGRSVAAIRTSDDVVS